MENRKGSGIFLGVISIATLVVAIIGATFAYFSASAVSNNQAIRVEAAELALGYADVTDGLNTDLIPASDDIALYAGTDADWVGKKSITYQVDKIGEDGKVVTDGDGNPVKEDVTVTGKGQCYDDNMNEVCSVYTFTIGNPNFTTAMDITGRVTVTTNEFSNLWFAIYDETNTQVVAPKHLPKESGAEVSIAELNQQLVGSTLDTANDKFDAEDPTTYTRVDSNGAAVGTDVKIAANVRTYTMILWVHETGSDQTDDDSGSVFTGGITFDTGSGKGVTGIIASAQK